MLAVLTLVAARLGSQPFEVPQRLPILNVVLDGSDTTFEIKQTLTVELIAPETLSPLVVQALVDFHQVENLLLDQKLLQEGVSRRVEQHGRTVDDHFHLNTTQDNNSLHNFQRQNQEGRIQPEEPRFGVLRTSKWVREDPKQLEPASGAGAPFESA